MCLTVYRFGKGIEIGLISIVIICWLPLNHLVNALFGLNLKRHFWAVVQNGIEEFDRYIDMPCIETGIADLFRY